MKRLKPRHDFVFHIEVLTILLCYFILLPETSYFVPFFLINSCLFSTNLPSADALVKREAKRHDRINVFFIIFYYSFYFHPVFTISPLAV